MFGLGPELLIPLLVVAVVLEVALFWAAASLVDAPPLGLGKTALVGVLAAILWAGVTALTVWFSGIGPAPLLPENRTMAYLLLAVGLGVMWLVPTVLYVPLVPVSVPRGLRLSFFQVLLRAFLYVLIFAVGMVVLAVVQIATRSDVTP